MTLICVSKLTIIGSDNGLAPTRWHAIIWINDGILLIWPLGINFSEILIKIHILSFKKMHLEMSSGNWRPFCLGPPVRIDNTGLWLFLCFDLEQPHPKTILIVWKLSSVERFTIILQNQIARVDSFTNLTKRWVFRFRLNASISSHNLISFGKQFHARGPYTANARLPKVSCLNFGTFRTRSSLDLMEYLLLFDGVIISWM